jgi:cytochrome c
MLEKIQTNKEEGRTGPFLSSAWPKAGNRIKSLLPFLSLSHCSIAMEKAKSEYLPSPHTHCAFCLKKIPDKKGRRLVKEHDGVLFISGQSVIIGSAKFVGAKFACLDCHGKNGAAHTVLVCSAPVCPSCFPLLSS